MVAIRICCLPMPWLLVVTVAGAAPQGEDVSFFPSVDEYLQRRQAEFGEIPAERKAQLRELADYVRSQLAARRPTRLTFICTHNSRRSHMAQIWAAAAAARYGVDGVTTFSGGTEATAFNPRAVAAIERAGAKVDKLDAAANPRYAVRFRDGGDPLVCFSKVYSKRPNPDADYCAVMTCSQADEACPRVEGSSHRVAITYDDPKAADGTPAEAETYDERCAQICREMLYVFAEVQGLKGGH